MKLLTISILIALIASFISCTRSEREGMVLIPAGEFEMGTDASEIPQLVEWAKQWRDSANAGWFEPENPRHTVYLDAFYMDKYEVTNDQYCAFLNDYGRNTDAAGHTLFDLDVALIEKVGDIYKPQSGYEKHPFISVYWYGAAAYAQWVGARLPTEAEWEKAARGGLVRKRFPWGDSNPDDSNANLADKNTNCDWSDKTVDDGYERTAPVGSYVPNGYGLYDMAGNVWEWCADEYDSGYYSISPKNNPKGPGVAITFKNNDFTNVNETSSRGLRGGNWLFNPYRLRCAYRSNDEPSFTFNFIGFRCAQDL